MNKFKKRIAVLLTAALLPFALPVSAGAEEQQLPALQESTAEAPPLEEAESESEQSAAEDSEMAPAEEMEQEPELIDEEISLLAVGPNQADMRSGEARGDGFMLRSGEGAGLNAKVYYAAKYSGAVISSGGTTLPRGHITYCIEPKTIMLGNNGYVTGGTFGSKDFLRNLTTGLIPEKGKIFKMLGQVMQVCGPEITDGPTICQTPAQATRYLAAQIIIWQLVCDDMDENFNNTGANHWKEDGHDYESMDYWNTAPAGGRSIKSWYDEWIDKLKKSKMIPSFCSADLAAAPLHTMDSDVMTLTDEKNVLPYMEVSATDSRVKIMVKNQTLTIQNPEHVDFQLTFRNTLCSGAKEPIPVMAVDTVNGHARQTSILASAEPLADEVLGYLKVKAQIRGNVEVTKASDTGEPLSGAKFAVFTKDGAMAGWMTDCGDGRYRYEGLPQGEYTVRELAAPEGYYTDAAQYPFSIAKNGETVQVQDGAAIINESQTGDLRIVKEAEQDDLLHSGLAGYEFRIYSADTGYDAVHQTDEKGEIYLSDLMPGLYTIHEVEKEGINQEGSNFQFVLPKDQTVEVRANQLKIENLIQNSDSFTIDAERQSVITPPGQTIVFSADIYVDRGCRWQAKIQNQFIGQTGGSRQDDAALQKSNEGLLQAGKWQHIYFSYTNTGAEALRDGGSGISLTGASGEVQYQLKNVRMTLAKTGDDDAEGTVNESSQNAVVNVRMINTLRRGSLTVTKVDAGDAQIKLAKVKLLLEKKVYYLPSETPETGAETDETGAYRWQPVAEKETDEKGQAVWSDLVVGDYRLTETKAADGYQLLAEPVYFSLPGKDDGQEAGWSYADELKPIDQSLTIANRPVYEMPESGGKGNALFYAAGGLLLALGLGCLYAARKKGTIFYLYQ